jgi:hypothetical protein
MAAHATATAVLFRDLNMLRRLGPLGAERLATGVLGLGAAVTIVISLALCGIHVRNDRDKPQPRPAKVSWR